MKKRNVLFTDGMSSDALIICTDAPKNFIEDFCKTWNEAIEDGKATTDIFKEFEKYNYFYKILFDSEMDNINDMENIGYTESYDLSDYYFN